MESKILSPQDQVRENLTRLYDDFKDHNDEGEEAFCIHIKNGITKVMLHLMNKMEMNQIAMVESVHVISSISHAVTKRGNHSFDQAFIEFVSQFDTSKDFASNCESIQNQLSKIGLFISIFTDMSYLEDAQYMKYLCSSLFDLYEALDLKKEVV